MLGKSQKETLESFANYLQHDHEVLRITIHPYRPYTREFGSGFPISISLWYTDVDPPDKDLQSQIALCQHRYTAFDKAKELARYLCDEQGIPRNKISIKSKIGKET